MWRSCPLAFPFALSQNRAGSTPRREVDESNYRGQGEGATPHSAAPRCALNRTETEGHSSCHDTMARCPPYGLPPTPLLSSSTIIDHTVRGRSVSFSPRLKTRYSIFTDSSLFTISEVRYSRHFMKRYDKFNVKFNLNTIWFCYWTDYWMYNRYLCFYN